MNYKYHWLHIPTGKQGISEVTKDVYYQVWRHVNLLTEREYFLAWLDRCNATNPGIWQYWEGV